MPRRGVSLVELLVVIAIAGSLLAILVPAVQSARDSSRRTACINNLRQVGLANQNFESAKGHFPSGAISKEFSVAPWTPHNYYRWSALTQLLPFLENSKAHQAIDLDVPLYGVDFQVLAENRDAVAVRIPEFLCPADQMELVNPRFGPTNYAACAGAGNGGGTPFRGDGIFFINSALRIPQIQDGLSQTVAFSESILGRTPPRNTPRADADPRFVYGFARAAPLTEASCEATALWNFTQPRGFSWANGEYRSALYNHYWPPNSSRFDCISAVISGDVSEVHAAFGWRTARSWHANGVNAAYADGSARFLSNDTDLVTWRAIASRSGGELPARTDD